MKTVVIIIVAVAIAAAVACLVARSVRNAGNAIYEPVDELKFASAADYFGRSDIRAKLDSNGDYVAVAMRAKGREGRTRVSFCIYDSGIKKVLEGSVKGYAAVKLDAEFMEKFGDKDMIVVK